MFRKLCHLKALKIKENSETGYIFETKIPKLVEDEGILWAPPRQVEIKCSPALPSPALPSPALPSLPLSSHPLPSLPLDSGRSSGKENSLERRRTSLFKLALGSMLLSENCQKQRVQLKPRIQKIIE